jgi:hypothetical protein
VLFLFTGVQIAAVQLDSSTNRNKYEEVQNFRLSGVQHVIATTVTDTNKLIAAAVLVT